ncbi:MAG: nucleotidyltransferase domain-containing protein [Anaerolineae bacterium]|nr:nucleotidyltransferase domain-containing protein [Anaerolineae bacterium]
MTELNSHSLWRLELAQEISHRLRRFAGLQAIIVGGSVARNYADEYSDLEIPLFWDELPADAVRKAIVAELQADFLYPYNGPAAEDNLLIKGFQVDFWHNTVAGEEKVIEDVLQRFDTSLSHSNFMDTIRACIPLYGQEIIHRWKEKARCYPRELVVRNIQENLVYFDTGHLELHARRDNPTLVYAHLAELQKRVFLVLLALNRQYFPSFKWMYKSLETMQIRPTNIAQRFRNTFNHHPDEAIKHTLKVISETLALVHQHYPQIDLTVVEQNLSLSRAAHGMPVHL